MSIDASVIEPPMKVNTTASDAEMRPALKILRIDDILYFFE